MEEKLNDYYYSWKLNIISFYKSIFYFIYFKSRIIPYAFAEIYSNHYIVNHLTKKSVLWVVTNIHNEKDEIHTNARLNINADFSLLFLDKLTFFCNTILGRQN